MARVFLSYKRKDKDLVFPLKDKIEAAIGEPCWIDLEGIESDAQFAKVVMNAIAKASIFLFMYSKCHSEITDLDHDWTIRELSYAEKKGKRIVFCNIDKTPLTDWFDFMYPYKQQVDMTSPEDLERLLEDLREWLGMTNTQVKQEPLEKQKNLLVQSSEKKELLTKQESLVYAEGWIYEYNEQKREAILRDSGTIKYNKVVIPSTVQYKGQTYRVVAIGNGAFAVCSSITSVIIPSTVKSIGNRSFIGCQNLSSLTIPNSITSIGDFAFWNCKSLTSVTIPNSVKSIGFSAFPDTCKVVSNIQVKQKLIAQTEGWIYEYNEQKREAILKDSGTIKYNKVVIPSTVQYKGQTYRVVAIGNGAFAVCSSITSVIIPSTVKSIGNRSFLGCQNLSSVTIPNSITSIGDYAFKNCSSLTSLTIPKNLISIGIGAFPNTCKVIRE